MEVSSIHVVRLIMTFVRLNNKSKTAHILVLNKNKVLLLSLREARSILWLFFCNLVGGNVYTCMLTHMYI